MAFTFKQFHIDDVDCGMPVSTDGVILGAWAPLTKAQHILDIGAGSGLLSLMAAQRSQAQIVSVELDNQAALACQYNFAHSPWAARLTLIEAHIQSVAASAKYQGYFNHIICNPPYFEYGPQAQNNQRAMARHTDNLPFTQLITAIELCLSSQGQASVILPTISLSRFNAAVAASGLFVQQQLDIQTVKSKITSRAIVLLGKQKAESIIRHALVIRDENGRYTPEMVQLTQNFYLKL